MKKYQAITKRSFDLLFSLTGILLTFWLILLCWLISTIETRQNGFFVQHRIGIYGKAFRVIKLRTMRKIKGVDTTITVSKDPRISNFGRLLRGTKIDELPQLINVFLGKMSFVGPRPDVPGYADQLEGDDAQILELRPGITGPASFYFRNEEELLQETDDPKTYNDQVIWPQKVKINRDYQKNYSFLYDIKLVIATITPMFRENINVRIEKILRKPEPNG